MTTFGDLINASLEAHEGGRRGPVPARVERYDAATQTIDAKPLVKPFVSGQLEELPIARSVPVAFPQGGGVSMTWPLEAGDVVFIVPCEADISRWHTRGELEGAATRRRADLSDSVAIPGVRSLANSLDSGAYHASALVVSADDIRLGSSGAVDPVALSSLVDANFTAIFDYLEALAPLLLGVGVTAPPTPTFSAVGASKVKGE